MILKHLFEKTSLILLVISLSACATPTMFENLKETGYIMSPNFSAAYEPGTLIQTARLDENGKESRFKTPVVIMVAGECFPGKRPQQKELALPVSHGQRAASLDVGASALSSVVPSMNFSTSVVKNHSLTFDNPQVIYFPISEIFGQLSPKCVGVLNAMQQAGNKIEWFEIIYEAVVASSLSYKIEWGAGVGVDTRLALTKQVQQQVASWTGDQQPQDSGWGGGQQRTSGWGSQPQDAGWGGQQQTSGWGGQPQGSGNVGNQQQTPGLGSQPQGSGNMGNQQQTSGWGSQPQDSGWGGGQQQTSGWGSQPQGYGEMGSQQQTSGWGSGQQQSSGWGDSQQPVQDKPKLEAHVRMMASTSKTTELRARGTVVIAYRSAALRPIKR